ncbi:STAS domain-containing protein [Nonomuraea sp. FMUSA5-5]|uniref:STAS domain-containing protein n=1 Tax=Nonomuraea composti TaxID=2720023 RepID=A0ABX1B1U0_9ACTN|nr:STAS domain-containing protein [Nonomuraea sp. FMUSA5-5]NJP91780.1 STAS domain-containing protein [Nonomuraea sp. FMUSA5-5]
MSDRSDDRRGPGDDPGNGPGNGGADVLAMVHPFGLRVRGDIDRAGRPLLARALAWALRTGKSDIHLDLSELTFIDAAGLRLIAQTAAGLPPHRALVLRHAPASVPGLLALLGWRLDAAQRLRPETDVTDPQGPDPAPSPPL